MTHIKEHINDPNNKSTDNKSTDNKSYQIMIIPAGTQVCPEKRATNVEKDTRTSIPLISDGYYITLEKSIEIVLHNIITCITINGTTYHIIDESRYDPKIHHNQASGACCDNTINNENKTILQSFIVPADTPYYISDTSKDPIGLIHKFNADETVRIRPGSSVFLPKNTKVVLFDHTIHESNKKRNDVFMVLEQITKCTI